MFVTFIRTILARRQAQTSIGTLLARADAHLLDDIGLTRAELLDMLHAPVVVVRAPVWARVGGLARA